MDAVRGALGPSLRALLRSPGYASACVAVLALGIGANTAMFSVVYGVVIRPLPYPHSNRLVIAWEKIPSLPAPIGPRMAVQRTAYEAWRRQTAIFTDMAAFHDGLVNEGGVDRPRTLSTGFVSSNLFPLLGARAQLGRLFRPEEEAQGSDGVVVLSDAYFDRRFHRNPSAIGSSIALGRATYTVIGVLPSRFHLPALYQGDDQKKPEVWLPLSRLWNRPSDDTAFHLYVVGMLAPDVSLNHARAALSALQTSLNKSDPERYIGTDSNVFPIDVEDKSPDVALALYVLLGAVAFLLLIGCGNLANLTLARATSRAREIAIRRALGASRGRIVRLLLTESLMVSLAGAAASVFVAEGAIALLLRIHLPIPRPEDIELNFAVFVFAAVVSVATTMLFGLAPALTASAVSVNDALKSRGGGGASAAVARSRHVLTAVEVALALAMLCGAGLLIRSFVTQVRTGVGFDTEQLAVTDLDLDEVRYPDAPARARFYEALIQRARALPGAASACVTSTLPLHRLTFQTFEIVGRPAPTLNDKPNADVAAISPDCFGVIGLPIQAGRGFTAADLAVNAGGKGDGVAIVNQTFAARFFNGQTALGQRLLLDNDRPFAIIGIVGDFRSMGALDDVHPQYFVAGLDKPQASLLVRTRIAPESLFDPIRATIWSLDPDLPAATVSTMNGFVNEANADSRSIVWVISVFAGLALLLAMVGVYAVLANLVAARTREIGIRMALGATPATMARMVAAQSSKPIAIGVVAGVGAGLALGPVLKSLLVGIGPYDPATFALAVAAVLFVTPFAVWVPLRRATRVECIVALRDE